MPVSSGLPRGPGFESGRRLCNVQVMQKSALQNYVREQRERLGMSQVRLAAMAQVTRQSMSAIEAGRSTPAVDVALRIAQALGARVEEVFGDTPPGTLFTEVAAAEKAATGRVCVADLGGRWVSHALRGQDGDVSADGFVSHQGRRHPVELLRPEAELRENVVVMGCAPALGVVASRLNRQRGAGRFVWLSRSSTVALEQLAEQRVHIAGVHLVDSRTGDANASDVRRIVKKRSVALVTLGVWQLGWVTAPGNPKRIRGASDVARRGVRLVVREPGSGARRRLEAELRAAGVPATVTAAASVIAHSHLDVARAVFFGAADTGVTTLEAARALELELIPFGVERYDLTVPIESLADARIERFLDALTTGPVRRELAALGYDTAAAGKHAGELLTQ